MPKRKRPDIEEAIENIQDRAIRIQASRLHTKIDHGNKTLKAALNLARGFERQKLGRRQKQASNDPHTLLRLREEVIVLKELDIAKIAKDYLFKQLVKTKRIKEAPAFVAVYGEDAKPEPPKSNAEANVLGRLFKANPVKEVLPSIMDGIRQVLNLDEAQNKATGVTGTTNLPKAKLYREKENLLPESGSSDFGGFSDKANHQSLGGDGDSSDDINEAALEAYNSRVAGSSDENEDEDENNVKEELDPMQISDEDGQDHDRDSLVSLSSSEAPEDVKSTKKPGNQPVSSKVSSTSFLPSLSMGGYYSGSESGDKDIEDHARGPAIPLDRKNRRGQRARQKIAELKYGQSAKHLQKQHVNKDSRNSGWDAKRGAVDGTGYNPKQRRFGKSSLLRSSGPTGANGEVVANDRTVRKLKPASKKNDGPIHPSWEAAKKRKEESGKSAFAGKKITFD